LISNIFEVILVIVVLHFSFICIVDVLKCEYDLKLNYPIIIDQLALGIFFLPFVGFSLLFVKKYYWKILGAFALIVSVWDIGSFLQRTAGAL
jgi:hypothetical protein